MYRWHLIEAKREGMLTLKLGRFINKECKALVDSGVMRNYVLPAAVRRMGLLYRDKENLYLLVTILGDLILYRDSIIEIEIGPVKVEIKGRKIIISFNILLLGKDEVVLKILFFKEFNPRINWVTR